MKRVNSQLQNLDRQVVELNEAGVESISQDKLSSKDTNKSEF